MHWILQNNIFSEPGWDVLLETLERFELSHSVHKVVPFVGELLPEPALEHHNVICFGSYSMRHVACRSSCSRSRNTSTHGESEPHSPAGSPAATQASSNWRSAAVGWRSVARGGIGESALAEIRWASVCARSRSSRVKKCGA